MKKTLVSLAVLSLMVGAQVKAADANKAMPAIISYLLSGGEDSRFTRQAINSTDAIVEDKQTGLFWQDEKYTDVENDMYDYDKEAGDYEEEGKVLVWENAKGYCENLTFGGHSDWRLPSSAELHTIVDTSYSPVTINPTFNTIRPGIFWTSSKVSDNKAQSISFKDGKYLTEYTDYPNYTRCVRGEKKYERVSINSTDGIVKDKVTNLWWQDEEYTDEEATAYDDDREHGKVLSWQNAINYCESLNYGSYSDWHLPSLDELKSIVDTKYSEPSINPVFKNTRSSYYWPSTSNALEPGYVWYVNFYDGHYNWTDESFSFYVRCVRAGQ